jgi:hypothetical protein
MAVAVDDLAPEVVMSPVTIDRLHLDKTKPGCETPLKEQCAFARAAADRIVAGRIRRLGSSIMLRDRYELPLSTASSAARDASVAGCEAKLTMYPGAIEAFDRAIAADPGCALAYAAKAQALLESGDAASARASMASANSLTAGLSPRERSHVAFFDLLVRGDSEGALSALGPHLDAWPRDVLVLATTRVYQRPDRVFRPRRAETYAAGAARQACPELR